ncbi:beta-L-arabinofuranosidase domain-containing protein [Paenibacillaceae bacterium WGS1546]|uniref:beta-L-arabinofuranosidase domain-containing protein n=1 Tax=Cohnella sp. WGS1546 TaxID=3366810 RepID=UPI00372D8677
MKVTTPFSGLKLSTVRPTGWILKQLESELNGYSGHLHHVCEEARSDIFAEGRVSGDHIRQWWNGETEGNWMDGLTRAAYVTGDPASVRHAEEYLNRIVRLAQKDGYIGIYKEDWRFRNDGQNGELWTYSRILLALLAYYEATGNEDALSAIRSSIELVLQNYTVAEGGKAYFEVGSTEHDLGKSHGLMVIEPLLMAYDIVGDGRIVEFVRSLYDDFSACNMTPWGYDAQLHRLLDPDQPYIGHGAHTCEHLRIPLLLYHYTGEEKYKLGYESAYRKLNDYLSVSGACKSDEMIGSDRFTCLPLPTVGYEYCAVTEHLLSLHAAAMLTGEGRYADQAEWLLFNAGQALKSHNGKGIAYLGADNQYEASKRIGTRWDLSPTHDDEAVCCVPNAVRILPYHVSRMWTQTPDGGLALLYYGPNTLTVDIGGAQAKIEQRTAYPFEGDVRLRIGLSAPAAFPLKLRIPGWAVDRTIRTSRPDVRPVREGDYFVLNAEWRDGDEITLSYGMQVEKVETVDHTVAIRRGPLLYALDIPGQGTVTKDYGRNGFSDIDFVPEPGSAWDYTLQIREDEPDLGFTVLTEESGDPWNCPPVKLLTEALNRHAWPERVALVPIGSTTLRKTCFPYVSK